MNIQEIIYRPKEYRVVASTRFTCDEKMSMIGGDFKAAIVNYAENEVTLWNSCNSERWSFKFSDVRELTPTFFKKKRIAIGDQVLWKGEWRVVYGYTWFNGQWVIFCTRDIDNSSVIFSEIEDHRTGIETDEEKAIKLLTERGRIKDGKIVV